MLRYVFLCCGLLIGLGCTVAQTAPIATFIAPPCDPITGCPAVIAATTFQSHPAFALNNGITSATVVPTLGRVMAFGLNDKSTLNWLWNNKNPQANKSWQHWGGSKTWLAPQSAWLQIAGAKWPPDSAWNKVVESEVQTGGFLKTTGSVSSYSGIRIDKLYGHDESGNFFIRQTAEKVSGKPLQTALWSVTQIDPPDAVFFLLSPKSTFSESIMQLQGNSAAQIQQKGELAYYIPRDQSTLKIGISTTIPVLAALRHNQLFVLRATPQNAIYPDATSSFERGFPIEIFDSGALPQRYLELEFYSPLQTIHQGSAWTFTVKWNIYTLSTSDLQSPQLWNEVEKILKP